MSASGWREKVTEYIRREAQPVDKFGHQPRLYALAKRLGSGLDCDDDVLFASAWMHDLGVFAGHRPQDKAELERWNHVPYTIERATALLAEWGFPENKLEAVAEVIRTHQPQDEPQTLEAVLIRDADILEQLGSVGAARALAKVGRDSRYATFSSVVPVLQKAVDQSPAKLRTEEARRLAGPRIERLRALLAGFEDEAGDLLF
jgi:uncharacterized protein